MRPERLSNGGGFVPRILSSLRGWTTLLAGPSSYLLLLCVVLSLWGKSGPALLGRPPLRGAGLLIWSVLPDAAVYLGLAALFALIESRWRPARWLTVPAALSAASVAALNAGYLLTTGEQGTWETIAAAGEYFPSLVSVISRWATAADLARVGAAAAVAVLLPLLLQWRHGRRLDAIRRRDLGLRRARYAAAGAALAFLGAFLSPAPRSLASASLGKNVLVSIGRTMRAHLETGRFTGYSPERIVSVEETARLTSRTPPNLLVVILESTRFDHTSLSGAPGAPATPNLAALAERGLSAPRARTVVPHTTKSLFSILCGRLPVMQKGLVELSSDLRSQCLPAILAEGGYRTAFFQSAHGTFEERPRLAQLFGYDDFFAWEDIQGESLGYLGSDDESLVEPFGRWLDKEAGRPFMATVLTSATHHPYRLSRRILDRLGLKEEMASAEERYGRIIEAKDVMLGEMLDHLRRRGLLERTVVVVTGDHGEGFGEHGIRQHNNTYYEEGLRVPLVFAGPGLPRREVAGNASLVDVTPTLLDVLGIAVDPAARGSVGGVSLLDEGAAAGRPRWFSCWFELTCRGYVLDGKKVVYEPAGDRSWYFDLDRDPGERSPLPLTADLDAHLDELNRLVIDHTARDWRVVPGEVDRYPPWHCEEGVPRCDHPRAGTPRGEKKKGPSDAWRSLRKKLRRGPGGVRPPAASPSP